MAIGMEIEIPIPVDGLSDENIGELSRLIGLNNLTQAGDAQRCRMVQFIIERSGRLPHRTPVFEGHGFRVVVDHDDRVLNRRAWPPVEGGYDSMLEIVTDPLTDGRQEGTSDFNMTMDAIGVWIQQVQAGTYYLTQRWNRFPNPSIGPLQFPGHERRPRQPNHNFRGSCQVNVGIDLREYHSMLKWFANSPAARSRNAETPAEQDLFRSSKHAIREAVAIGRGLTRRYLRRDDVNAEHVGNFRGLRGFVTHLALYIIRGREGQRIGGTEKNLAPVLLKSPLEIAVTYGMTIPERYFYVSNFDQIATDVWNEAGRVDQRGLEIGERSLWPSYERVRGNTVRKFGVFNQYVPLAGVPILTPTGVGPERDRLRHIQSVPAEVQVNGVPQPVVGAAQTPRRGGVVGEFRSIPGYYNGVDSWRQLGRQFLDQAEIRNSRNGIRP